MRRTPLKKKSKAPKARLRAKADALAGAACRARGVCEAAGWEKRIPKACGGILCWCHIKNRSYYSIRHAPWNSACLCAGCHEYFGRNPDEWHRFVEYKWPGRWDVLNEAILRKEKPDYEFWIRHYQEAEA